MPSAPATDAAAYPLLIKQLLLTPLAVSPGQEIVYGDTVRYDYRTLHARIGQLAGLLTSLGVKHGDTVAVMDWDSNRYLEAYFAVPMIGAVLMMVNVRLAPEQIAYTLNHSGARVLLVNREFLPLLDGIDGQLPDLRTRILMEDTHGPLPAGFVAEYEAGLRDAAAASEYPDFDENTRATVFYTTGTTGLPKGVSFSHRQLVLHSLAGMAALGSAPSQGRLHRDDVYMPITPMFHVHAWGLPYVATLMGIKQVYPGRYLPANLLALIAREKVTFSHCVPTILHMLLEHPDAAQADLQGWKVIIGGAALPRALAQRALARGIDIFGGYGMSETCPLLTIAQIDVDTVTDADEVLSLRTKAGLPVPLVDLRIVDPDMGDVVHDGVATGEVVARAPWLTQGYLHDPEASATLWAGGYLHTGDIGNIDVGGYLRVTDRIKDVIKTGGEWISSLALEDIIALHPAVSEVAVIGIADTKWGERPLPLVVRKPGKHVAEAEIIELVAARSRAGDISRYAIPERVNFVDAIERTSVGKINKKKLRGLHDPATDSGRG
ncbi:fatty acid--CoA ligase [Stenotrophomonas sp. GD03701]|uniref:Fatty acid--CoA ligase n=1 Tax=Stenotrophomonas maltophilia TaxID=40324 RepID=A0A2J0SM07_STEMA|nr:MULTISPECIES: fatty acid--CoA ligase [Stenotrophomonas]MBA0310730.1 fatty acid--CoA ligase [Stenotrophomonas maltophilia]MDH1387682.1 fatty acid--CoA ligase [Stenotrophomonas sp. GD03701]MDH1393269.1 fatty acid--CoA ligase [Stenotrophomonas sp. GD03702]MDQ7301770.1 fatty acid--CoA ligase [Stenotrophomonas sp. Sm0581]PJK98302.1 long-chain fatty acid--CoA ligase [Stenotrophomonas maltophilia]